MAEVSRRGGGGEFSPGHRCADAAAPVRRTECAFGTAAKMGVRIAMVTVTSRPRCRRSAATTKTAAPRKPSARATPGLAPWRTTTVCPAANRCPPPTEENPARSRCAFGVVPVRRRRAAASTGPARRTRGCPVGTDHHVVSSADGVPQQVTEGCQAHDDEREPGRRRNPPSAANAGRNATSGHGCRRPRGARAVSRRRQRCRATTARRPPVNETSRPSARGRIPAHAQRADSHAGSRLPSTAPGRRRQAFPSTRVTPFV